MLGVLFVAYSVAGCQSGPQLTPTGLPDPGVTTISAPDPEVVATVFLESWARQDYAAMYAMLSTQSQEAQPLETFEGRYQEVWTGASLTGLDYEIVSSLVSSRNAQVRYRITLHSLVVGDVTYETWVEMDRSSEDWAIAWNDAAILSDFSAGDQLATDQVTPTRANIYDREGLAMATESDIVAIWIIPNTIGDAEAESHMLSVLSRLTGMHEENIQAMYEPFRYTSYFIPFVEVSLEEFRTMESALNGISGVQWAFYSGRYYVDGGVAPHAVGYVAQIQQEELEAYLDRGYLGDEFVGRMGLENSYENELRGTPGGTLYHLDSSGRVIRVLASRESEPPQAVYATLDREFQRQTQEAIAGFRGAIVVLERDTGAVLAMASAPGFDPNLFDASNPNSSPGLASLFERGGQWLVNRATHGIYPLGSVFKIITMAAALESELYTPSTIYTCNEEFRELPGQILYDWTVEKDWADPHGSITLVQALERSCNPYFWHIGLDLYNQGLQSALPDMAVLFGLGEATGIEIGDTEGQVPNPDWKQQELGEPWMPGDAVQLATGQGALNVTPLQVARFIAAIGNGGVFYRPQIIQRIQTAEGEISHDFEPIVEGQLPVSAENLATIQQAMVQVVREREGTARRRFLGLHINVAGKTGTAESGYGDPHSWFAGYTFEERDDKPDIAVVVLVEYQGEGSEWAAPIFRRVVEAYFFGRPIALYRWESRIGVVATETPEPAPEEATATPTPTTEPTPTD
jgi:penicillin-binding protein 2